MQKRKKRVPNLKSIQRIRKIPAAILLSFRVIGLFIQLTLIKITALLKKRKLILIGLYEHIGDIVSCEPVIQFLHSENPNAWIVWALHKPYGELVSFHPYLYKVLKLKYFSEWVFLKKIITKVPVVDRIVDLHISGQACRVFNQRLYKPGNEINLENYLLDKSLLQAFTRSAGLPELKGTPFFYLDESKKIDELPGNYIVLHTKSNMSVKDWAPQNWNQLCQALIKMDYYIFEIGLKRSVTISSPYFIDYTGKKSLQEIAQLIAGAKLFIGIDSGFAHIANALQKDGLILLGKYENGHISVDRYNPFTGKYSESSNIIYAAHDFVKSISAENVIYRVNEKLAEMSLQAI